MRRLSWRGWFAVVAAVVVCFGILIIVVSLADGQTSGVPKTAGITILAAISGWRAWGMRNYKP